MDRAHCVLISFCVAGGSSVGALEMAAEVQEGEGTDHRPRLSRLVLGFAVSSLCWGRCASERILRISETAHPSADAMLGYDGRAVMENALRASGGGRGSKGKGGSLPWAVRRRAGVQMSAGGETSARKGWRGRRPGESVVGHDRKGDSTARGDCRCCGLQDSGTGVHVALGDARLQAAMFGG